jgi:hypothetical protein
MTKGKTQETASFGRLTKGDADLLRFAAWAEIVESDLWTQYNELGGATKPNDGPLNVGNPPYKLASKISIAAVRRQGSLKRKSVNGSQTSLISAWILVGILGTAAKRIPI